MTLSIDRDTRQRALTKAAAGPDMIGRMRLVAGIRWFTVTTSGAAVGCLVACFTHGGVHIMIAAATLCVVSSISGALWCGHALLADRLDFYQRGQLDGWIRGWRGQEPEVDDPLIR